MRSVLSKTSSIQRRIYSLQNHALQLVALNSSSSPFPHIFRDASFGNITLKNRIIMGSMHTGLEEGKLDELASFYAKRSQGQVGLIVTGGISPNQAGRLSSHAAKLTNQEEVQQHRLLTSAVHYNSDSKIAMQILHAGRYAKHPHLVAPSALRAPINKLNPKELTKEEIQQTIKDYASCALLAQQAGYDGVEIMGSEGYLINEFLVESTNKRNDDYGGTYENRMKFPVEIVKGVREAVGKNFIIIYRLSMLDLVEGGSTWEEIKMLAEAIRQAGASIINTGIGWHEAPIPTIATVVPRAAFTQITKRLRNDLGGNQSGIYFCTSNRINTPEVAERVLAEGHSDFISMARPFLADAEFVLKAKQNKSNHINTCIACNQACLDHIFEGRTASCLVNPYAGHEKDLIVHPVANGKKLNIAIVGAGPSGLACAVTAAQRGHKVTLFEKDDKIGGQFNLAKRIPGKEEFYETMRYFGQQLKDHKVHLKLKTVATLNDLKGFDSVVLASGVFPRNIDLPLKTDKVKVYSYLDVLRSGTSVSIGKSIAVIGAGGIGYDMCEFLTQHKSDDGPSNQIDDEKINHFFDEWGVDATVKKGGVKLPVKQQPKRKIYLLQRKPGKFGSTLGKTTGWIHRAQIKMQRVEEIGGCKYLEVNEKGLLIEQEGKEKLLEVDTVIVCAGQVSNRDLYDPLIALNKPVFLIGGSQHASELDAKRAIDQGTRLAANIENAKTGDVFNAPNDLVEGGLNN